MIAVAKPIRSSKRSVPRWHKKFLAMLPLIRRHAAVSFRQLDPEARAEAVQEVICNAMAAYRRLVELKKEQVAYPSALARYGVAQVRAGRRLGGSLNVRDVTSVHCQLNKGVHIDRLDYFDDEEMAWTEVLIEDRTAGPAETAASRIDFASWLRSLSGQKRKVATTLATGETTQKTARKFHLSPGRVSQLRTELKEAWEGFVGDNPTPEAA
ncbi:MAG: hypothetical protein K8T91_05955 [Planctomycetes bacterium]|nr:hypothetical protein [Planctomycetota bacterium]